MDEQELNSRLSQITTCWHMVIQAHQGQPSEVPVAQRLLMARYGGAVYRYLQVPPHVHRGMMAAESKTRFYHRHVRRHYRSLHVKSRRKR